MLVCEIGLHSSEMGSQPTSLIEDPIVQLLLTGCAETAREAERLYLEEHLDDVVALVNSSVFRRRVSKTFPDRHPA